MATTYPLPLPCFRLRIGGTDRSYELESDTLRIQQLLGAQVDTCAFSLKPAESWRATPGSKPTQGQSVYVDFQETRTAPFSFNSALPYTTLFGGRVTRVNEITIAPQTVRWDCECVDWTVLLQQALVNTIYVGWQVSDIVRDVVRHFAPNVIIDANVEDATLVIQSIAFAYEYPLTIVDRLAQLVSYQWFVDGAQVLHFFDPTAVTHQSPQSLTDTSQNWDNLEIEAQLDQVRNRVFVQGGEALSGLVSETYTSNGMEPFFPLGHQNVIANLLVSGTGPFFMTVNGTAMTVGLKGTDDSSLFPGGWMVDVFGGGVWPADAATPHPADGDQLIFTYQFKTPIGVVREDPASMATVAALAGEDYETIVLADRPKYYYHLDDAPGTLTAANYGTGGVGASGTYSVAIDRGVYGPLVGPVNFGADFYGGTVTTVIGTNVPLTTTSGFSFEAWVQTRPALTFGSDRGIIGLSTATPTGAALYVSSGGTYSFITAGGGGTILDSQITPEGGQYDHVVATWDGHAPQNGALYVNNVVARRLQGSTVSVTTGLEIGNYNYSDPGHKMYGRLARVAVYDYCLSGTQVAAHYQAGRWGGVREAAVVDNALNSFNLARGLGDLQLARWANVVTVLNWRSFVSGWLPGDTVTVNVTASGMGRTFAGNAVIQALQIDALGAQRLRYTVTAQSTRFNVLDWQKVLARQGTVVPGDQAIAPVNVIDARAGSFLLVGGNTYNLTFTPPFYVAPDWGTGTLPFIVCAFWQVDPNLY